MLLTQKIMVVAAVTGIGILIGCSATTSDPSHAGREMLFYPDGRERPIPSFDLIDEYQSAGDERPRLIERLASQARHGAGYSRLAAADALMFIIEHREGSRYLSSQAARDFAQGVIRVVPTRCDTVALEYLAGKDTYLVRVSQPYSVVEADGRDHVLKEGLPQDWKILQASMIVDGSPVALTEETPGIIVIPHYKNTFDARIDVKAWWPEDRLRGQHQIRVDLTLLPPGGQAIVVSGEMQLDIAPVHELVSGSAGPVH